MPFVKLDCQALDSTLWILRPDREVFLTALLMADPWEFTEPQKALNVDDLQESGFVVPPGWYGFVQASGPGIVRRAIVSEAEGLVALRRLASPEPDSRSHDFEGRRMVRIDGGYVILNFQKFRERDYSAAERMRRYRLKLAEGRPPVTRNVTPVTRNVTAPTVTLRKQKERTEGEVEGLKPKSLRSARASLPTDDVWMASLKADPANTGIDVDAQAAKCRMWCSNNGRQFTRKTFVNWLIKADRAIPGAAGKFKYVPWQNPAPTDADHAKGF
jgi:hypothetical protein